MFYEVSTTLDTSTFFFRFRYQFQVFASFSLSPLVIFDMVVVPSSVDVLNFACQP